MDDLISRQAVTKFLNDWLSCLFENCHKQSASDLKMIIKDFKNLPSAQPETNCSEIPNNSDVISKQAALETIRTMQTYKLFAGDDMLLIDQAEAQTELMMLPPAQPERKTGRWIESNPRDSKVCRLMTCSECGKAYIVNINVPYEDWTAAHKFCVECGSRNEVTE